MENQSSLGVVRACEHDLRDSPAAHLVYTDNPMHDIGLHQSIATKFNTSKVSEARDDREMDRRVFELRKIKHGIIRRDEYIEWKEPTEDPPGNSILKF